MKAKSKVLLGLIVALAMMVFAVPAFAAMTFTVTAPTPAEQEVFVGDEASFSFKIADATQGEETDAYELVDYKDTVTDDATAIAQDELQVTPEELKGAEVNVTVKVPAAKLDKAGTHTFTFKVKKTTGEGAGTGEVKTAKITVKALPTAKLTGYDEPQAGDEQLEKTGLAAGDVIGLNAIAEDGAAYQWQIAEEKGDVTDPEDENWKDITGETKSTLGKATADMNGKYVRCVVTVDGKAVVAAADANILDKNSVKLEVADPEHVTVTTENKDATYYVGTDDPEELAVVATGGTVVDDYKYQWYQDGKAIEGATEDTYDFDGQIDEDSAGVYKCVVTDDLGVKGESKEVTITVNPTPTLTIAEVDTELWPAKYDGPQDPSVGIGVINLTTEEMEKALTLTAVVEDGEMAWSKWYKIPDDPGEPVEIPAAANKLSYTIPAGDLEANAHYGVAIGFNKDGLKDPLKYGVTIREVSGQLEGDLLTTKDGTFDGATKVPTYKITLPEGQNFQNAADEQGVTVKKLKDDYKVTLASGLPIEEEDSELKFDVTVKSWDEETETPATMTLTPVSFKKQTKPSVGPMAVTVENDDGDTVNLPIDEGVGYAIAVPATEDQIEMTAPVEPVEYTGEAVEATVEPAEEVKGLGEITNIRYEAYENEEPDEPGKDATTEAPTDAGKYVVWCDVKDGDAWAGAEDLKAGTFKITKATITEENADQYFVIDPKEVEFNGENQEPEVAFADGVEGAGEITKVTYKLNGAEVKPLNVGEYEVYVTTNATEENPDTNVNLVNNLKVGTFTINKVAPTAALYTIEPTEVTYTGAEQEPAIKKVDDKAGDVAAVHYYAEGSEKELEGKPVEAGVYTVTVDTKESDDYAAKEGLSLGTFTIKPDAGEQPTIYINPHVENIGWAKESSELEAGESIDAGTTGQGLRVEAVAFIVPEDYKVVGFAHVQNEGDVDVKKVESSKDYEIPEGYVAYEFGSTGKGQRVEAVCIGLQDADGEYVKGFQYATHLQNYGWQGYVRNGSFSGTRGMGLRMESIRFTYADPDVVKPGEPSGSLLK